LRVSFIRNQFDGFVGDHFLEFPQQNQFLLVNISVIKSLMYDLIVFRFGDFMIIHGFLNNMPEFICLAADFHFDYFNAKIEIFYGAFSSLMIS